MLHGKTGSGIIVVWYYVFGPESLSYSGIMSQKLELLYSRIMLVILDYACIQDSVNMEWWTIIMYHAPSMVFSSYYGITGT